MSQPVKLSDALVLDARLAGGSMQRSISGQVEFWARIGRSVELLLQGQQLLDLSRKGTSRPLSECLDTVDSPEGQQRLSAVLHSQPFPHYAPHPNRPGLLERFDADGRTTVGRFVNRRFQPVKTQARRKPTR